MAMACWPYDVVFGQYLNPTMRSASGTSGWTASNRKGPSSTVAIGSCMQLATLLSPGESRSLAPVPAPAPTNGTAPADWRECLWTCPEETRLGVREVAEALGRTKSWVYRRTGERSAKARLPHRKLDGELVFTAGELRKWIHGHETRRAA